MSSCSNTSPAIGAAPRGCKPHKPSGAWAGAMEGSREEGWSWGKVAMARATTPWGCSWWDSSFLRVLAESFPSK